MISLREIAGSGEWESGRRGLRRRAVAFALVALGLATQAPQVLAVPHRVELPEHCARAATERLGATMLPAGPAVRRELSGRNGSGGGRYLFYVDIGSEQAGLPLRLRMYCTVDAAGEVRSLSTIPRVGVSQSS
jgi:hypothetical protein